jgi:hypothetical protein
MKIIFTIVALFLSGWVGYYFGQIKTYPKANVEGRKFGFALGKQYCEDPVFRGAIEALFPEDLKYASDQERILKDKLVNGGLSFY